MNASTRLLSHVNANRQVRIRLARTEDSSDMLAISNWAASHTAANFRSQPETLDQWIQRQRPKPDVFPCLVAESADLALGYALASPFHDGCGFACVAELSVYIHPNHAGRRIGSALYQHLIPMLDAQGFQVLVAMIALPNPASERLHERFGFQRTGGFTGVGWKFDRWHDISFWQRSLRPTDRSPAAIEPALAAWNVLRNNPSVSLMEGSVE